MKLSLILLLLQVWVGVQVSVSQNVCSTLPNVPHAHVSEETKKTVYQEGDVIHFSCEPGYMSDQTSKFVCTTGGWLVVHQGKCFFSDSSCDPPPTDKGLTVKGLPEDNNPMRPDHILIFSCDQPGHSLTGSAVLICGKHGQWNNPFPSCTDRTCKLGVMHPHLYVAGLPPSNEIMTAGHKLLLLCYDERQLAEPTEIECLENGQWNSPFPTCPVRCKVPEIPDDVKVTPPNKQLIKGQILTFECIRRGHYITGNPTAECLSNGQWSHPFPTCGAPQGCGQPPPLLDGDITTSIRREYDHNAKVEYSCANYYTMEGGPYKTCINGEWTGHVRCRKPCTVNREDMNRHNIQFKYKRDDKLYSQHDDEIEFRCTRGRRVGTVEMRQRCNEGVVQLPTCQ